MRVHQIHIPELRPPPAWAIVPCRPTGRNAGLEVLALYDLGRQLDRDLSQGYTNWLNNLASGNALEATACVIQGIFGGGWRRNWFPKFGREGNRNRSNRGIKY